MGPDELDDLLASIRAESKGGSALALYEGTRATDLVSEKIDERILNLLGLDDVFDIDYATYISLLKERAAAARMTGKNLATEEAELVTNEFKRVKGKVGRFKIQKKKITASSIAVRKPIKAVNQKALMPAPAAGGEELIPVVKDIDTKLDELLAAVKADFKAEEEREKQEKKSEENQRRRAREKKMEAKESPVIKSLKNTAKKIVSPFQAILDRIFKFIGFTLLGYGVDKFFKWFSDPNNKKKIETIGRFLKDWWPSLAFAAGLFLTPFVSFVRRTLKLLRFFVPQMVRFMAAHPLLFATAAAGVGAYAATQMNEEKRKEFKKTEPSIVLPEETAKTGKMPGVPQLQQEQVLQRGFGGMFNNGGIVRTKSFFGNKSITNVNDIAFDGGGSITKDTGLDITGAGPDTQLIAAAPGEIVIPRKTVNKYGSKFFMNLIHSSGMSGNPRFVNNIQLAQNGGIVGALGNMGLPGTGTVMSPLTRGDSTVAGYQQRLLGIPLGKPTFPRDASGYGTGYSQSEMARYEQFNKQKYFTNAGGALPKLVDRPNIVGDAFKNFGRNVQTIRDAARRQEEMMRKLGYEPDGYTNFSGQPINLGPQSSIKPIGTPVVTTETKMIVLPPKTTFAKKPDYNVKSGTDIPDFSPIAAVAHRMKVTEALGISNLV